MQAASDRLVIRSSTRSEAAGIALSAFGLDDWTVPLFFAKVRRALEFIGRYEPRRLERISRDIATIGGIRGGASYYSHSLRMIILSWPAVLPVRVESVAATIIHEATHCRIRSAGIPYDDGLRSRIERACVEEEAAFALRLPGGEAMAKKLLDKLDNPWWTTDELHRLTMQKVRAYEMPEWFIRFVEWRHRRRKGRSEGTRGHDAGR